MNLTRDERLIAAQRAAVYPPGRGEFYFWLKGSTSKADTAARQILRNPKKAERG